MNNNYNYNNQQMPNQNMNFQQPMNYGPQPMPNQNMNFGYQNQMPVGNGFMDNLLKDKVNLIGYIGAIVAMIGCFCPFSIIEFLGFKETISYFSNNGELADGAIVFVFMVATLVLLIKRKNVFSIGTTGIGAIIFLNNVLKFSELKEDYGSYADVQTGAAVFLVGAGLLALVVHYVLYIKNNPNCFKEIFDKHTKPMFQNQNMGTGPMPYPNNQFNQQPMNQGMNYNNQQMPNQNMNYNQPNSNNQYPNNNNMY